MPPGDTASRELFDLLARLVSIDSINPDLVPGSPGEGEVAAAVASWARERGLEVHVEETGLPGRPNVIAVARGRGGGRSLMLNAHMDTVGVAGMENPFRPATRDGRLFGRGAMDTKAALAAFMTAAARVRDLSLAGDVILTAVVDEEYASAGTEAVLKGWKADAAVVGEPTGLAIVTAHKGFAWFEIETRGIAAHGSRPDAGVDAIAKMGRVLVALERIAAGLAAGRRHPILGPGSIHASLISGGQELSSYPAACRLSLERRTLPGEDREALERELRDELAAMARADPSFAAEVRTVFTRQPMEVSRSLPAVQALARCVARVTGQDAEFSGMGAWMDSSLIAAAGIPAVILGPRGDGLHGVSEWVDLDSVRACADIAVEMARDFCG